MAIDCNPGHLDVPLNLILLDSLHPEDYDTLVCANLSHTVLQQVMSMHHHRTLHELLTHISPYLLELGSAFSEDQLPARDQFLVVGHDGCMPCDMDPAKGLPTVLNWLPRSHWSQQQEEVLSVATRGMKENAEAVILSSDYFNQVAQPAV